MYAMQQQQQQQWSVLCLTFMPQLHHQSAGRIHSSSGGTGSRSSVRNLR